MSSHLTEMLPMIPLLGSSVIDAEPKATEIDMKMAFFDAPDLVDALAPDILAMDGVDEKYENKPSFAPETPQPLGPRI